MENENGTATAEILTGIESYFPIICDKSGAPGLSLSVTARGKDAYTKHFGFRDVDAQKVPDGSTTYFIGSLTKAMTSATVGILVEEGKLEWSTRIASVLPELEDAFDGLGSLFTITDLLSHRTGVARSDGLWLQRAGNILLDKSTGIQTWTAQPRVRHFRTEYLYSNYAYDMVGRAIEKIEGKSLGACFKEKLFDPLGMTRTSAYDLPSNNNAAKAYFTLKDGSPVEVPIPTISDQTLMAAAGSVRSCTDDLAKFYTNFMHAANHQTVNDTTSTPASPFKQLKHILHPHNHLGDAPISEQSYGLGWGRVVLPAVLGAFNYNKHLVHTMPEIGAGSPNRLTIYHGGSMQGFTCCVYLLPETETAIIALQNSTGLGDACDWISQMIINQLSGPGRKHMNFKRLAYMAARKGTKLADWINIHLKNRRGKGTKPLELKAYTGKYWNQLHNFHIDVSVDDDGDLLMTFQGMKDESYKLRHHHHDSFVWNLSHDETAKQGRFQTRPWVSYLIEFDCGDESGADGLRWKYDADHESPAFFSLEEGSR
ncbi:hypothetical protein FPSE_04067 [Fusarium pseudograminearum CS3096]|uniref:Beta-lactamase-related domain-containing protein n=1 Tax=Fusarium pseudograminearum (strain CS3096) TaxID=1028729 RepID=K3VLS8_FUSPC|nr:hypothetical protein FPSE_04067 [Fusarium pseudograminearum CS3096]EKJ75887.1 hypothetical protein FPSE_04067 [Fusarium pseudograminearum CS3096]